MRNVRADFDRIALVSNDGWDHNSHYHSFLLKHLPPHCVEVLEIGCGTGAFSRRLATRSGRVLALDLSPQMIRIAKERSGQHSNIDFQVADALAWEFPAGQFDCVASIATLHHLPYEEMLSKMKRALKLNGTLIVLDIPARRVNRLAYKEAGDTSGPRSQADQASPVERAKRVSGSLGGARAP